MRLNVYLARAGVASRRKADVLIKDGQISVNGRVGQLNDEVSSSDEIIFEGRKIELQNYRYILLNKPTGYVTTLDDPQGRKTVIDLIKIPERVVPVGRLDFDTTGVLLLTNDGGLANSLMHPRLEVDKVYEAEVEGSITDKATEQLAHGVDIGDGVVSTPAKAKKISENKIELIIHEGRKHQVKKMLAAVGVPVKKLHRSNYAGINLNGLDSGKWRDLTAAEVKALKMIK